jgi:hypothetical protein
MTTTDSYHLTIRFAGICTHFRQGVVAGVPHRVALPNAAFFRTGVVTVKQTPEVIPSPMAYSLMPHFAQLEVAGGEASKLSVPALVNDGGYAIQNGDILSGVRLQVRNCVDQHLFYDNYTAPRLTDFVPFYSYSGDVVSGGRAICFFDLFGGKVTSCRAPGGAVQTIVQIETDGVPELLVTPLGKSDTPPRSVRLPLFVPEGRNETTLLVKNLEEVQDGADGQQKAFDFLLHYLTDRGGIPQVISLPMPGMESARPSAPPVDVARVVKSLEAPSGARRVLTHPDEVTPSCSNSQYP